MKDCSRNGKESPEESVVWDPLQEILRKGAREMLRITVEGEVKEYLERHRDKVDEKGHHEVVRNGYMPERSVVTGIGRIKIRQPRVDDRKLTGERFSSRIIPRYMRRIKSVDNTLPILYLKGISLADIPGALVHLLGEGARGVSASTIGRLKESWLKEYGEWSKRDLSNKKYVYFWADGIYCSVRHEDNRSCLLVIMGADEEGNKELVAVTDGVRESTLSWKEALLDLKRRGLTIGPKLAVGDGALGFWAALDEVYPDAREQRCWVHKTANILDKAPKGIQAAMKKNIHDMYMAATKEDALKAYDHFISAYGDKFPKAAECLIKDKDKLFTFYDFPAKHWIHIRTTNPIESTFATVRHRSRRMKNCGSRTTTFAMVYKLVCEAQKTWHKIKGYKMILKVLEGVKFVDGIIQEKLAA
jgi:transposase-like protein